MSLARIAPSSGSRLAGIEGLRAVAACSIVVYHCWLLASPTEAPSLGPLGRTVFPNLPVGVTLFFALSAYLLYRPFAAALIRAEARPSVSVFLRNRALRIFPAYWVILLVSALILGTVYVRESPFDLGTGGLLHRPGTFVATALLVQNYSPNTYFSGIGPAWSLAIELAFYVTLPLFALLAWAAASRATTRSGRTLAALTPAALLLAIGLSGKAAAAHLVPPQAGYGWFGWVGDWNSVLERSFWAQADLFAFGLVVAVLRVEWEDGRLRVPSWVPAASLAGAVLVAIGTAKLLSDGHIGFHKYGTLMALACGLLLTSVVLPGGDRQRKSLLVRILEVRPIVAVGLVSYSLFLWARTPDPVVARARVDAEWLRRIRCEPGGGRGSRGVALLPHLSIRRAPRPSAKGSATRRGIGDRCQGSAGGPLGLLHVLKMTGSLMRPHLYCSRP
jgi:peptidoglycan/LPS O-acetylase OafA/YrhL